jgi:hypothetical protein
MPSLWTAILDPWSGTDTEGYVCGLLCGGKDKTPATYITPIEYVLEDIRTVCGACDVRLVVKGCHCSDDNEGMLWHAGFQRVITVVRVV